MPRLVKRILPPMSATLRRYGLTVSEWQAMLRSQGGVCAVCRRIPPSLRLTTDHHHVKGWKKMPPSERKRFVRGILCARCNHQFVCRGITITLALAVAEYLRQYEARLNA